MRTSLAQRMLLVRATLTIQGLKYLAAAFQWLRDVTSLKTSSANMCTYLFTYVYHISYIYFIRMWMDYTKLRFTIMLNVILI